VKTITPTTNNTLVKTDCNNQALLFPELTEKILAVDCEGGHISSDGGGVLVARLDRSYGYVKRFEQCFTDYRNEEGIEHSLLELLRQRIYGLALGYEDLNDHDRLRGDPLLASLCGKSDPLGKARERAQDQGKALAGKSTLNRLELTPAQANQASRYKKIVADEGAIQEYFIKEYVRGLAKDTREVILDLDRTNDSLHGDQEGRYYEGYYREYCYTPLYIFDGYWPVVARLDTADSHHMEKTIEVVAQIVKQLRQRFAEVKITLRADSSYARDPLMSWCEENNLFYVFGIAGNKVLEREVEESLATAQSQMEKNQSDKERVFKEITYRASRWKGPARRVVGKAEWTRQGSNPRFIITNLPKEEVAAQPLYEKVYCGRGNMENRIKEQQMDLFADRTSTHSLRANQLRLWFSTLAYLLINQLRQVGLVDTPLARATSGTIRLQLFKIGALVRVTVRRVWVSLSSAYPWRELFEGVAQRLESAPSG